MSRPKEEGGTLNLAVPLLVWIAVKTVRSLVLRVHLWGSIQILASSAQRKPFFLHIPC